jgi:hypothetical protein
MGTDGSDAAIEAAPRGSTLVPNATRQARTEVDEVVVGSRDVGALKRVLLGSARTFVARNASVRSRNAGQEERMNSANPTAWLEELSFDECLAFLHSHEVGRIAVIVGEFPIVLPVNYSFVESGGRNWVVLRTRPGGVVEQGSVNVSFQIDGRDPTRRTGWSVLVRGTLQRVNPDAAGFRERFDPDPWIADERDAWLIVEPFAITGRRLHNQRSSWTFHPRAYL